MAQEQQDSALIRPTNDAQALRSDDAERSREQRRFGPYQDGTRLPLRSQVGRAETIEREAQAEANTDDAAVTHDPGESASDDDAPRKKRGKRKKAVPVSEAELMPKPSYWPLVLAIAIVVLFLGMIIHPILLGLGVVLIIASIIGWALERR